MVIGEAGAGSGYFTFKLAKRVGKKGKIYANDISQYSLNQLKDRAELENVKNITTVLGETEDPLFPSKELDMIIMVYVLHDLEKPVEFLKNLKKYMKNGASLILLEQEPAKTGDYHFWSQEKVLETIQKAGYHLKKKETFLIKDTLYILKIDKTS
jgi:ubiquinone/menaquinone biosynthesis C-methylase UbiE